MTRKPALILASSSPYRRELLTRLNLEFNIRAPNIDESAHPGETATDQVKRLSEAKARKIADSESNAVIIGSDQIAVLGEQILTKPGNRENAISQLSIMRGNSVTFFTGLCVINSAHATTQSDVVPYVVRFRDYSDSEIVRYLDKDSPYECAGSFKSEASGITLLESMTGEDPTALIGLPLLKLSEMLRNEGFEIP